MYLRISDGSPRPVSVIRLATSECVSRYCAAVEMPTVVGEMMPFRFGYPEIRPCNTLSDVAGSSLPYTVSTSFIFGYFLSCSFMYLIHEFWFVALAAADRIAIWPSELICLASRSTSDVPMVLVSAWLMKRWFGLSPHCTSESNATILMPCRAAVLSEGHRADGSFPAMTIASACAWMAAWMEGCWAAAVS